MGGDFLKKCLLIVLLILSVSFSFSCGGEKCTNHIDSDLNGKCDVCDADFKTKAPCEEHMDENKDGECDVCGADFKTNAPCEEHTDENKDGKCDVCGKDMPKEVIEDFVLFEDEEATFQVVIASDAPASARQTKPPFAAGRTAARVGRTRSLPDR